MKKTKLSKHKILFQALGLFLLLWALPVWSSTTITTFNRTITVKECTEHAVSGEKCLVITQTDPWGAFAPALHITGNETLSFRRMVANQNDEILIVGGFADWILWDDQFMTTPRGGPHTFHIIIDPEGRVLHREVIGEKGEVRLVHITFDAKGRFLILGEVESPAGQTRLLLRLLNARCFVVFEQFINDEVSQPTPENLLYEEDEEPVEDPIG